MKVEGTENMENYSDSLNLWPRSRDMESTDLHERQHPNPGSGEKNMVWCNGGEASWVVGNCDEFLNISFPTRIWMHSFLLRVCKNNRIRYSICHKRLWTPMKHACSTLSS